MKHYTFQDAAEMLGIDSQILRHWVARARFDGVVDAQDSHQPILSQQQIEWLARTHDIPPTRKSDELPEYPRLRAREFALMPSTSRR